MGSYLSAKFVWVISSSYISFRVSGALRQFEEISPKYPQLWWRIHRKSSKILNSTFYIKLSLAVLERPSKGQVIPVLVYLRHCGKSAPNTPNHWEGYTENDLKVSIPHFKSNEALLKCKGYQKAESYLLLVYLAHWGKLKKLCPNASNYC